VAVTKPRNKAVLFRVTEDEYNRLVDACSTGGARSLSDFARARLLGGASSPAEPNSSPSLSLAQVEEKLDELKSAVDQLTQHLGKS